MGKLLTFTFSIFNILHVTGQVIGDVLRFSSAILFRSVASFLAYFILALTYTLVNLAFGVPMDGTFGHGGFVVYWLLNTFTMGAGELSCISSDQLAFPSNITWFPARPQKPVLSAMTSYQLIKSSWLPNGITLHPNRLEMCRLLP